MKRFTSFVSTGVGILACCLLVFTPAALAATNSTGGTGQALEIAPPLVTLSVSPGQTVTVKLQLRDVSKGQLVVTNEVNDFVAAGEDGTPKILLNNQDSDNPYSLKGWINPLPQLLLKPQEIKSLPVTLKVPANASPGGHYGVIRFTGTPPELKGTGVSLSASLGALLLVTVKGPVTEKLSVQGFEAAHLNKDGTAGKTTSLFESAPVAFVERIKNEGNIHEEPGGQVSITNMFGKTIAGVNVNLPPRNILPASTRKFTQSLDKSVIGNKKLFGRYTATLHLTYGANKQTLTSSLTFWVIPYRLIAIVIVLIVGGFFLLRHLIRRYNRRIITKAQNPKSRRK